MIIRRGILATQGFEIRDMMSARQQMKRPLLSKSPSESSPGENKVPALPGGPHLRL